MQLEDRVVSSDLVSISRVDGNRFSPRELHAVEQIYTCVFPAAERRPLEAVLQAKPSSWLACRGNDILGFALVATLKETNIALLQYLGVDPGQQSRGVGTSLLHEIDREFTEVGIDAIVLEVEDPDIPGAAQQTARRLNFYQQWGVERLACLNRYYIPDLTDPRHRLPMLLLWHPVKERRQPSGTALKSMLTAIFMNEYVDVAGTQHLYDLHQEVHC